MSGKRASSRRQARSYALQALFAVDLAGAEPLAALNGLWDALVDGEGLDEQPTATSDEVEFAQRLVLGAVSDRERIDTLIEEASTNWRLRRMPLVDRNILRLATYELLACEDIPANVSINEAIELAKRFGAQDTRVFVNGLIDRIGRTLGRIDGKGRSRGA